MLTLSQDNNPNYVAKVVTINKLIPHKNADRLQIAMIDFQPVIVWIDTKIWDTWVYIPVEACINSEFLSYNNMYSSKEMNKDKSISWYIWKRWRIKATKLRWEYSMGLFITEHSFYYTTNWSIWNYDEWYQFDTITTNAWNCDWLFVWKYEPPVKPTQWKNSQWSKPQVSRIRDWQFHLHIDTYNIRSNMSNLNLDDTIAISYKLHWTSATFSNCLVKARQNFRERVAIFFGKEPTYEYDVVYASRRVIKNKWFQPKAWSFYTTDHRGEMAKEVWDLIMKWYTFYWEIVWYWSNGERIQKWYDYWCKVWQKKFFPYRVTFTNHDWYVYNLNTKEAADICNKLWFETPEIYYTGTVRELLNKHGIQESDHWQENLLLKLEDLYNWKRCHICSNDVPAEWIIIRKERSDVFEAYKLKCREFLLNESKDLDSQK